jgi:acetyl-CoA carboxylase alpha subunit
VERHLKEIEGVGMDELLTLRYEKFRKIGTVIEDGTQKKG